MASHEARKESMPYRADVTQPWGSNLVESSHEEAVIAFGELAVFTMMWRPLDFEAGRVDHCSRCFGEDPIVSRQAAAFNQPIERECPVCFGTTFEGGIRAQILRPTLISDRNAEVSDEARGSMSTSTLQFETTGEFVLHRGDYLFRADNTRFQVEEKAEAVVRSGFGVPQPTDSFSGSSTARQEEQTSVAFKIPPVGADLLALLDRPGGFLLPDLRATDMIAPDGYL